MGTALDVCVCVSFRLWPVPAGTVRKEARLLPGTVTAAAQGAAHLAAPRGQPRQQQQQQQQALTLPQQSDDFVADPAALDTILNHEGVTDATHAVPLTRATLGGGYTREEYRTKASSLFHGALRVRTCWCACACIAQHP